MEFETHAADVGDTNGAVHIAAIGDVNEDNARLVVNLAPITLHTAMKGGIGIVLPDIPFSLPCFSIIAHYRFGRPAGGAVLHKVDFIMAGYMLGRHTLATLFAYAKIG